MIESTNKNAGGAAMARHNAGLIWTKRAAAEEGVEKP